MGAALVLAASLPAFGEEAYPIPKDSPHKLEHFTRQFVYLRPEVFVIFDRVVSTRAEFPKRWLLHTNDMLARVRNNEPLKVRTNVKKNKHLLLVQLLETISEENGKG